MRNPSEKRAWWKEEKNQKLIDCSIQQTPGNRRRRSLPKISGLSILQQSNSSNIWPDVKRRSFAEDEEDLIIKLHALLGDQWSLIAGRLPGRTGKEVKSYWNSYLKRKLASMGIDPNSHRAVTARIGLPLHRSRSSNSTSAATTATRDKVKDDLLHECQHLNSTAGNDKASDSDGNQDQEIKKHKLPDLNLELPVSTQYSSLEQEQRGPEDLSRTEPNGLDMSNLITLLLFR